MSPAPVRPVVSRGCAVPAFSQGRVTTRCTEPVGARPAERAHQKEPTRTRIAATETAAARPGRPGERAGPAGRTVAGLRPVAKGATARTAARHTQPEALTQNASRST